MAIITCRPKSLTAEQAVIAARRSIEVNPANAMGSRRVMRTPAGRRGGPRRLVLLTGSRWPETGIKLTVQFLDNPSKELRRLILLHMNAWNETANIEFLETNNTGMVRIARFDHPKSMAGYWSYVGTQILGIAEDEPTLNLEGFTARVSDAEFRRVVRHEAGHTLGFEHEHLRSELVAKIDRKKAFAYFEETEGWTKAETSEQVLTPLAKKSIFGTTEADPISIMCYEIPAEITKDGKAITGGLDIGVRDRAFAAEVYPKLSSNGKNDLGTGSQGNEGKQPTSYAVESSNQQDTNELQIVILDAFDSEHARSTQPSQPKFARVFATYDGARVTSSMRLRASAGEPPTAFGRVIRVHERIKNYTNSKKAKLPSDQELIDFGTDLFETLFQGDVRRLYDEARARQQNRKLDIILTSMIPWIAEKPWEFAYDSSRASFLATEDIHLIRNVVTAVPVIRNSPQPGPLRILVAAAQPVGFGPLSIDQELEVIRRGFQPLIDAQLVSVTVLPRATPRGLQSTLSSGNFTAVHIIGHGIFDDQSEEGALFFEDDHGGTIRLGERNAREIFCKRGISLVFLNSCQSGSGGRHNFNRGVAQALVSHGLPAVVANQYSVLDISATTFAQHFYWALANGMSLGQAACEARIAVNCSLQGEIIDWAVPVVYARDPNLTLSVRAHKVIPDAVALRNSTSEVRERSVRVAVWDMDNCFPSLNQTLDRMNAAQATFGFELAALSLPLDIWDRMNQADNDRPYLVAEKLSHRLQSATLELGVNILICITGHWMRDEDWFNIYAWWPGSKKPPVVIFSVAGFEDLKPSGPLTDRAIANVVVSGLAGFMTGLGTHARGSTNCPLYFDEHRDSETLMGRQAFDAGCLAKLKKLLAHELPALQALLKAF